MHGRGVRLYWQREQHENTWGWQILQHGCGVLKWEIENEAKELGMNQVIEDFYVLLDIYFVGELGLHAVDNR